MSTYNIIENINEWDFENGFYLTCKNNRISDFISHLELYKMILNLPGDVLEFGVYKGSSFVQFLSFREYYENCESRTVVGFDSFGKFPDNLELDSDVSFVKKFRQEGGDSISKSDLDTFLKKKNFSNYNLIKGNILKTLPNFLKNNPERRYSLVHVDVDVYEPTKCILEHIWGKIVKGGIIILDDYGIIEGANKAIDEFICDKNLSLQKMSFKYKPAYIIKKS